MAHRDAVGDRDRAELQRVAAGRVHAVLHGLGQPVQREVAGRDLVPARRDPDLRLGEVLVAHADGPEHPRAAAFSRPSVTSRERGLMSGPELASVMPRGLRAGQPSPRFGHRRGRNHLGCGPCCTQAWPDGSPRRSTSAATRSGRAGGDRAAGPIWRLTTSAAVRRQGLPPADRPRQVARTRRTRTSSRPGVAMPAVVRTRRGRLADVEDRSGLRLGRPAPVDPTPRPRRRRRGLAGSTGWRCRPRTRSTGGTPNRWAPPRGRTSWVA